MSQALLVGLIQGSCQGEADTNSRSETSTCSLVRKLKHRKIWQNGAGRVINPVKELSVREQIMVEEAVRQLKVVINLGSPFGLERRPVDSGGGKK